jgi:hypothetical protein
MASTVRSHRADRGSIPRVGVFFFSLLGACIHFIIGIHAKVVTMLSIFCDCSDAN